MRAAVATKSRPIVVFAARSIVKRGFMMNAVNRAAAPSWWHASNEKTRGHRDLGRDSSRQCPASTTYRFLRPGVSACADKKAHGPQIGELGPQLFGQHQPAPRRQIRRHFRRKDPRLRQKTRPLFICRASTPVGKKFCRGLRDPRHLA